MSLITVQFALFFLLILILYYILPKRFALLVLLAANCLFVYEAGGINLLFMLYTAVSVYLYGITMERMDRRTRQQAKTIADRAAKKIYRKKRTRLKKLGMWLILGSNFGIWATFKILEYLSGTGRIASDSLFIPFAISYYTFIAAGYLIDIYREKYAPEKNFLRLFVFLTFFPQMTEGPFTRYDQVIRNLESRQSFSFIRIEEGFLRMVLGYCKKLILADRIAVTVGYLLAERQLNVLQYLMLLILLPLQQYLDFSGCMDIVLGAAHCLGIDLAENFRQPIFSTSIADVWRRWHITLCTWFRDYLFYPVATAPGVIRLQKAARKRGSSLSPFVTSITAMFVVWTVTGLWHGIAWNNIFWGWMNFIILSSSLLLKKKYERFHEKTGIRADSRGWRLFTMVRTYLLFGIMELMADASGAGMAIHFYLTPFHSSSWHSFGTIFDVLPGSRGSDICIDVIGCALIFCYDWKQERGIWNGERIRRIPLTCRMLLGLGMVFAVIWIGVLSENAGSGFAYARF